MRTDGRFACTAIQLRPRSVEMTSPVSVPRYRTSGFFRSSVSVLTTAPFRFADNDCHVCPKSRLAKTCVSKSFWRCPSNVAYTVPSSNRDGAMRDTKTPDGRPGTFDITFAHVLPASRETCRLPSSVPA